MESLPCIGSSVGVARNLVNAASLLPSRSAAPEVGPQYLLQRHPCHPLTGTCVISSMGDRELLVRPQCHRDGGGGRTKL